MMLYPFFGNVTLMLHPKIWFFLPPRNTFAMQFLNKENRAGRKKDKVDKRSNHRKKVFVTKSLKTSRDKTTR